MTGFLGGYLGAWHCVMTRHWESLAHLDQDRNLGLGA